MTKRGFAIEKHDGRCRNRCISDGEAPAGGGEGVADLSPRPSLAILQPLLNSTSLLLQWHDQPLSYSQRRL